MQSSASSLRRSRHLSAFAHMGDVYLYHDLYGYILKMSPDILAFLGEYAELAKPLEVCQRYSNAFGGEPPQQFVDIFIQFACLVEPDEDEIEGIWYMVPVKSKWNVWRRNEDGGMVFYTAWGEREPKRIELSAAEVAIWNAIDGERRLLEFKDQFDPAMIRELIPRLTHHDCQAVKLSGFPMSTYKGRPNLRPPYITSTMPYAPCDLAGQEMVIDSNTAGKEISTAAYYREQIVNVEAQFDHRETTLSHLLRQSHPALGERSYGQALVDALVDRGDLSAAGSKRVLEIGAGLGYVAGDVVRRLRDKGAEVSYEILELSPALAATQRERLGDLGVTVREGDAMEAELGTGYDFILANEMIGDLPAVELSRAQVGADLSPEERGPVLKALGEAGELISEMGLVIIDAPDPFYLNSGAIQLLRRVWSALAPGGVCVITEFGEIGMYPRLSTQLDHPELSIHFGHMQQAANAIGFKSDFQFIIDLMDFDRDLQGMATTRSYFRALRTMLAEDGIDLSKIGYTEDMLSSLLSGKVDRSAIGELYFDRIEDRLMGLVPHEFKALILTRPA